MTQNAPQYITQEDATKELGVSRATLYYYIKALELKTKKFPLDKHVYLKVEDVERIKDLKEQASKRGEQKAEENIEEVA